MATKLTQPVDVERRMEERLPPRLYRRAEQLDQAFAGFMEAYGITVLRVAVALVFIWFGALKIAGRSPVEDLVADTVYWLPSGFFVRFLGVWEVVVGVGLLLPFALRLTLLLFWAQMAGTFLTVLIHPDLTFDGGNPLLLTVTGEFILKNLVLIAAGLVIGSTVRRREHRSPR